MHNTKATLQKLEVYKCDFLNIRTGPSINYRVIGTLYPKQIVEVESKKGNWARFKHNGGYAWASLLYLRTPGSSSSPVRAMVMTTTASINIRTSASWSASIIEAVNKGTELFVTEYVSGDNWSTIWYNNQYAYVPSKYLKDTGRVVEGVGPGEEDDNEGEVPSLPEFAEPPRYKVEYKNKWWIECYSQDYPNFFFNTSHLKMSLVEKPVEQLSLMKIDATETIEHNGDIVYSNGTFDTTEIAMEFFILKENYNVVMSKLRQLCQMKEFRLIYGWDRSYYKKARLSSAIEIEEYDFDEIGYKVSIEFILQPYRYDLNGHKFVKDRKTGSDVLSHGSEIYNNSLTALPKIYLQIPHRSLVSDDLNGEKTVNTVIWSEIDNTYFNLRLYAHDESYNGKPIKFVNVVVDCEEEVVYEDTTNKNYNHLMCLETDFPVLKPGLVKLFQGQDAVNVDAKIKIVPNWREF